MIATRPEFPNIERFLCFYAYMSSMNAWSTTLYSNVSGETLDVLHEVSNERTRQVRKGWDIEHDARHPTAELADLARERMEVAGFTRESLIQGIAMLVSAVEAMDRRG